MEEDIRTLFLRLEKDVRQAADELLRHKKSRETRAARDLEIKKRLLALKERIREFQSGR